MVQLLIGLIAAFLLGVVLVVLGWRGKRINRVPTCRDCGFDLSRVLPEGMTCPECGAGLRRAKGVRIGQRRRRPVMVGVGLMLAFLPGVLLAALVAGSAAGVDWAKHEPVWMLAWQAERGDQGDIDALARELERRDLASTLSKADVERAGEAIVKIQRRPGPGWDDRLGDFIEQHMVRGDLGEGVDGRFAAGVAELEFVARQRLAPGDTLVIEPRLARVRAGTGTQMTGMLYLDSCELGGRALTSPRLRMSSNQFGNVNIWRNPGWAGGNDQVFGNAEVAVPKDLAPGAYTLDFKVRAVMQRYDEAQGRGAARTPEELNQHVKDRTREFEGSVRVVVEPAGTPVIEVVDPTEDLKSQVEGAIGAGQGWVWDSGGMGTMLQVNFTDTPALPVPVVGRATAQWHGQTLNLGQVILRGENNRSNITWFGSEDMSDYALPEGFDATEIDVVIVPDVSIAMGTADITRIYGGEIHVDDVTIEWQGLTPGEVRPKSRWVRLLQGLAGLGRGESPTPTEADSAEAPADEASSDEAPGEDAGTPDEDGA